MKLTRTGFARTRARLVTAMIALSLALAAVASSSHAQDRGKKGRAKGTSEVEQSNPDFIPLADVGEEALAGLTRRPPEAARSRGMIRTGLTPKFAEGVYCADIDDGWAMDYSERRGRDAMHGGIDLPALRGTPVRAIASGEVVLKALDDDGAQGIQIWLRHTPDDSGLPVWTYSQYTHLLELPDLAIGHRVRMGDVIGKTSNTGISGAEARTGGAPNRKGGGVRRDALHFAVLYSPSDKYFRGESLLLPKDGWWMDPVAIYRKAPPFDSVAMKALPAEQKKIPIPYLLDDGSLTPAETKLIWPYACSKTPLPEAQRNRLH